MNAAQFTKLLHLSSPMLPVGAYSYSQVLESAIEHGLVRDVASAQLWIGEVLQYSLACFELPVLQRLCLAWQGQQDVAHWNQLFCSSRETAELLAETLQMGYSLTRLLRAIHPHPQVDQLAQLGEVAYPTAYACAVNLWQLPIDSALQAYSWSWLENQVSAAIKLIPLGQTDGQRILLNLSAKLPELLLFAQNLPEHDWSNFNHTYALLSCQHETQYTRLFRS